MGADLICHIGVIQGNFMEVLLRNWPAVAKQAKETREQAIEWQDARLLSGRRDDLDIDFASIKAPSPLSKPLGELEEEMGNQDEALDYIIELAEEQHLEKLRDDLLNSRDMAVRIMEWHGDALSILVAGQESWGDAPSNGATHAFHVFARLGLLKTWGIS
jgi:hypothetical protein